MGNSLMKMVNRGATERQGSCAEGHKTGCFAQLRRLPWSRRLLAGGHAGGTLFLLAPPACASPIPTAPGLPLYVHLCESMPAADAYDWGKAAAAVNAELGDALRVGHGPIPVDATCSFVDVCPGEVETTEIAGACETLVRYPVGDTAEAEQVLWALAAQGGP